jgi:hypothetical protein
MRMSESKNEDTIDLGERLERLHPRFLEILKEVYPLAVLGSLCIATSAFAHQSYPEAQAYALTSASLFLGAFVFSFLFEISKLRGLALVSYVSTALAVLLLFVAIYEFGVNVPMISRTPMIVLGLIGIIAFSSAYYSAFKTVRKAKFRWAHVTGWAAISSGIAFIGIGVFDEISILMFGGEQLKNDLLWSVAFALLFVSIAFLVIFSSLRRKEMRMSSARALAFSAVLQVIVSI